MSAASTSDTLLNIAQRLVQTRGYNGFSFRDLAAEIGIKSASIHYHFPTKADLVLAVATRYRAEFGASLEALAHQSSTATQALKGYIALFQATLNDNNRICLCGMLASEAESLPEVVKKEAVVFFSEQEIWLMNVVRKGVEAGDIIAEMRPEAGAKMILATLEGAMIVARSTGKADDFDAVAQQILTLITPVKGT